MSSTATLVDRVIKERKAELAKQEKSVKDELAAIEDERKLLGRVGGIVHKAPRRPQSDIKKLRAVAGGPGTINSVREYFTRTGGKAFQSAVSRDLGLASGRTSAAVRILEKEGTLVRTGRTQRRSAEFALVPPEGDVE